MMLKYDRTPDDKKSQVPYLDNNLGITDVDEMIKKDYQISLLRATELLNSNELKDKPLNFETLCFIHKKLFGDIYPWAGRVRDVNLSKGYSTYYYIENLQNGIKEVFANLQEDNKIEHLTLDEFIELYTYYDTEIYVLHPFREGNSRSRRMFMEEFAKRAGFFVDYSKIDLKDLRKAEDEAYGYSSNLGGPNMLNLKIIFSKIITPIKNLEQETTQKQTVEQVINRHLWIYEREGCHKWMNNKTLLQGENEIKELLKSQSGVERICELLEKTKQGVKTLKVRNRADKFIMALKKMYTKNKVEQNCKE